MPKLKSFEPSSAARWLDPEAADEPPPPPAQPANRAVLTVGAWRQALSSLGLGEGALAKFQALGVRELAEVKELEIQDRITAQQITTF